MPVPYITANPASRPKAILGDANAADVPPDNWRESWCTTCAIAPAPNPRQSTAATGEYTNPPSHAPAIVGAPPINPSFTSSASEGRSFAIGERIAMPYVVL